MPDDLHDDLEPKNISKINTLDYLSKRPKVVNRETIRYRKRLPILEINGKQTNDCYLVDISAMGFQVESSIPMAINHPISIKIISPETEQSICLNGRVMWNSPAPPYGTRFYLGAQNYHPQWNIDILFRQLHGLTTLK